MRITNGNHQLAAIVSLSLSIWCGESFAASGVASLGTFWGPFFVLLFVSIFSGLAAGFVSYRKSGKRSAWMLFPAVSLAAFILIPLLFFGGLALLSLF